MHEVSAPMELYHPEKMTQPGLHIFSTRFCLLTTVGKTIADVSVAHCMPPFPELSDMPAVMA